RMPYGASHERMKRDDRLYDACLVLDWNIRPRRRGRGSAIFFHLARPDFRATQGCVAITERAMPRRLPHLTRKTMLKVVRSVASAEASALQPIWAVGLMTGTVLDGNSDAALLKTDGERIARFGPYTLAP